MKKEYSQFTKLQKICKCEKITNFTTNESVIMQLFAAIIDHQVVSKHNHHLTICHFSIVKLGSKMQTTTYAGEKNSLLTPQPISFCSHVSPMTVAPTLDNYTSCSNTKTLANEEKNY